MSEIFNLDKSVKNLGKINLKAEEYEYLRKRTKVFPYVCSKKWVAQLYSKEEKYQLEVFSTGMVVKERLINTDNAIVKLKIQYYDGLAEREKEFDSSILTVLGVKVLFNYGIRFSEDDMERVVRYLLKSEAIATISRSYSKLGWDKEGETDIFKSHRAISQDGVVPNLSYGGSLELKPEGSIDIWLSMVKKEVLPSVPMTVVMLLGFASPVLALLNQKYDVGAMMFNLSNNTSKGKTTSAMLATSVFSNPVLNRGCTISFNATENALIQFISECQGHTVVIDEVGTSNCSNFTRLMYTICNGRSKMRLNGDSTQKVVKAFSSVVISTAEFDLVNDDTPNGIKARVFEIKDSFTSSAENSDHIKKCIIENHGVAGERFMHILINKSSDVFYDYEKDKELLCFKCENKKELSARICSKLAVIVTTARYVNEALNLKINIKKIIEYMLKLERQIISDSQPEERLIEIVRQEVSRNNSRFKIDNAPTPSLCSGAIITDDNYSEIQITESEFNSIIKAYQVSGWKNILKKLKANGILITEQGHLYKRITLFKEIGRQKCYCFKVENEMPQKENEPKDKLIEELDDDIFADLKLED